MATTSPDNLWSPDGYDGWDLTVDLAAMQNSVQTALGYRAQRRVFSSIGEREAWATAPTTRLTHGDVVYVGTTKYEWDSSKIEWVQQSPRTVSLGAGEGWAIQHASATVDGPLVHVEFALNRSGGYFTQTAWTASQLLTGAPTPKNPDMPLAYAFTNQSEYPQWSLGVSGNGVIGATALWVDRSFASGGWIRGTFDYLAA